MIDFLPAPEKKAIRKEYRLRVFAVSLGMFSFVLTLTILSYLPTYFVTGFRYNTAVSASQSSATQERISQAKEVEKLIATTNKKIETFIGDSGGYTANEVFLKVLEHRPNGVTLTRLSYNQGGVIKIKGKETMTASSVSLDGTSSDRKTLLRFKENLAQTKAFSAIDLPLSSLVKDVNLGFSIKIALATSSAGIKN